MVDDIRIKIRFDTEEADRDLREAEDKQEDLKREKDREERESDRRKNEEKRKEGEEERQGRFRFLGPLATIGAIPVFGALTLSVIRNPEILGFLQGFVGETVQETLKEFIPPETQKEIDEAGAGAFDLVTRGVAQVRAIPGAFELSKSLARAQALTSDKMPDPDDAISNFNVFRRVIAERERIQLTFSAQSNKIVAEAIVRSGVKLFNRKSQPGNSRR